MRGCWGRGVFLFVTEKLGMKISEAVSISFITAASSANNEITILVSSKYLPLI